MFIDFKKLARDGDEIFASLIASQTLNTTERVVKALQKAGPQWSGEFSNSWTISTKSRTSLPSKRKSLPEDVKAPKVTGKEVLSGNTWLIRIENIAPYAAIAMDLEEGQFSRGFYLGGPINKSKWKQGGGRRTMITMKRGEINKGQGGMASRTAPLDWFANFKKGGRLKQLLSERINIPQQYSFLNSPTYRTRSVSD
tara:strand:- start:499 stop:1089 length:591 start_codon:yes stop_codon:yes gene_type:complete